MEVSDKTDVTIALFQMAKNLNYSKETKKFLVVFFNNCK